MKNTFAFAVLLAVSPSFAAAQEAFQPGKSVTDHYQVDGADVIRGGFAGHPAWKLTAGGDTVVVAALDVAKNWNDARSACRLLAPRGEWDLPKPDELAALQASRIVSPAAQIGVWNVYAAWIRLGNSLDQALMPGSDLFSKSTGPTGERGLESLMPLASFLKNNATDQINQPLVQALASGIEVRCLSWTVR